MFYSIKGPTWRSHRKIVTPCYGKKAIRHYADVFNAEGRRLAEALARKGDGVKFDVYFDVVRTTTHCVCLTLMGLSKEDTQNIPRMEEVMLTTQEMYNHIFTKMIKWWLQISILYWLLGEKKKEDYYIKTLTEMCSHIVEKRRIALNNEGVRNLKENDEKIMNVVDRYILCGELSPQEIVLETFGLFTTSQEASAKIASGVLLFLAHLPVWQDKVYNEIVAVLGPGDSYVHEEDLKKLLYLDMVYKEVLRYLPIAALIQRTVEDEIAIKNGEYVLSAGTTVTIPLHGLHRDPRLWEDPDEADPGRFSPENVRQRDPNTFIPYSLGPMDCLGRVYAVSLIKTLVVWVLRRLVLEAEGNIRDLELHVAISVKFAKGYNLRVRPRLQNVSK
ncbi:Cytochrome P450 4V2 [Eumeta japonica]|uniref:Cytochrome P450 4V2 n=1 Tax=Eumeta variegata TaxID=151549 RepID=A0A4C1SI00_EUMVA|nr:Cytochrome P450 4V2 [Eumeta japonica]